MNQAVSAWGAFRNMMRRARRDPLWALVNLITAFSSTLPWGILSGRSSNSLQRNGGARSPSQVAAIAATSCENGRLPTTGYRTNGPSRYGEVGSVDPPRARFCHGAKLPAAYEVA